MSICVEIVIKCFCCQYNTNHNHKTEQIPRQQNTMNCKRVHYNIRALNKSVNIDQSNDKTFNTAIRILVKSKPNKRHKVSPF